MYAFEQDGWRIETSGEPVCISFEYQNNAYIIQNDKPVVIKLPFLSGKKTAELRLYEEGQLVETRQGLVNRADPNQLEFRLSKGYKKATIFFND